MVSPRGLKPKKASRRKKGSPEAHEKRRKKRKRNPCQRIEEEKLSRDPQRPPKGSDPPRRVSTVNKRLRQFERKRQKETQETEEKSRPSQAPNDPARKKERISDLSWRKWEAPRGTIMKKYKKGNSSRRLSNRQNGIPPV